MITLFGATGYTGSLIAAVLERENLAFRIAGRSEDKLKQLSSSLPSHPSWIVADAEQPSMLGALLTDTQLLINCVGPFTDLGERVLSLAAVAGIHYLDTTNELGYVYRAQTYHALAQRSHAAIVPACAFEVALADCAAALLAQSASFKCETADVVYHLSGRGASRGTRLSALRSLATSWFAYTEGVWKGEVPGRKRKWFNLLAGRLPALAFPSSESVTIPAHIAVQQIDTWMTGSPISTFFAPTLVPMFSRFLRSWPGHAILAAASLAKNAPDTPIRTAPFEVSVLLSGQNQTSAVSLTGVGVYELTAEIIAYAAKKMLAPGFNLNGVLSPSQVLDPMTFFLAASDWGLHLTPDLILNAHA